MVDKRLVHLVDDDDAIREAAAFLLATAGYEVRTHVSGVAFLEELETSDKAAPCCVLLDIHMPGLSGLQIQLKLNELGFVWPVIILTGQADVAIAIQAMKNGAFEFLEKPYQNAALLGVIEEALNRSAQAVEDSARVAHARTGSGPPL